MGLLVNTINNPSAERIIRVAQEAARAKGVQLQILKASSESKIDAVFATLVQLHAGAGVVVAALFFGSRLEQLVAQTARSKSRGSSRSGCSALASAPSSISMICAGLSGRASYSILAQQSRALVS